MSAKKRLFDLFWTVPGILILAPLFALAALAIKLDDQGPVFFRQERVGRNGLPFRIWKFRTMVVDAEAMGGQLTVGRDPRVTRVGRWLRHGKLDELPQLINVLTGEMSLVGPRPEVPEYVSMYTADQRPVLHLTPGVTDPASIRYRAESVILAQAPDPEAAYVEAVMPDKIRLNLEYAHRATLWSDFLTILATVFPFARDRDR
ncbi:MAG: sugar transferase [Deferrisomatales bacterium]|nr:sugar transferase [Deferrisomatales bacterium]